MRESGRGSEGRSRRKGRKASRTSEGNGESRGMWRRGGKENKLRECEKRIRKREKRGRVKQEGGEGGNETEKNVKGESLGAKQAPAMVGGKPKEVEGGGFRERSVGGKKEGGRVREGR